MMQRRQKERIPLMLEDGHGRKFLAWDEEEALFLYEEIFVRRSYMGAQPTAKVPRKQTEAIQAQTTTSATPSPILPMSLKKGDVVVDVGANIGLFSLFVLEKCKSSVQLVSIEPIPALYDLLVRNVYQYCQEQQKALTSHGESKNSLRTFIRPQMYQCALGDSEGRETFSFFHTAPGESTRHTQERAIYNKALEKTVSNGKVSTLRRQNCPTGAEGIATEDSDVVSSLSGASHASEKEEFEVVVTTLSSLIENIGLTTIDFLKVDVEGDEELVLLGLETEHWHMIQQIVIEVRDHCGRLARVLSLLRSHEFEVCYHQQETSVVDGYLMVIPSELQLYHVFAKKSHRAKVLAQ